MFLEFNIKNNDQLIIFNKIKISFNLPSLQIS